MPFFEIVGRDASTRRPRSLHISARSREEAAYAGAGEGLTEIKLRPITDREVLMMDPMCFHNAVPASSGTPRRRPTPIAGVPRSLLLERPILTLTVAMLLALLLNSVLGRLIGALPAIF